jgi:molybdate transport system ATP-binding protein
MSLDLRANGLPPALVGDFTVRREGFDLDIELEIWPGEVLAVLGPNGSGKTTLLHALAGLHPLARGQVTLGGALLEDEARGWRLPPQRRRIGVVFQHHRLFPGMSVAGNVAYGPRAMGWSRNDVGRAQDAAMKALALEDLADRPASSLSAGALAIQPQLFLLDEPMAALDLEARATVIDLLRKRLHDPATPEACALLVTHRPDAARALADRWLVLEAGRALQCGTPEELQAAPASAFVQSLFE